VNHFFYLKLVFIIVCLGIRFNITLYVLFDVFGKEYNRSTHINIVLQNKYLSFSTFVYLYTYFGLLHITFICFDRFFIKCIYLMNVGNNLLTCSTGQQVLDCVVFAVVFFVPVPALAVEECKVRPRGQIPDRKVVTMFVLHQFVRPRGQIPDKKVVTMFLLHRFVQNFQIKITCVREENTYILCKKFMSMKKWRVGTCCTVQIEARYSDF
jgi:hypothetical protein